MGNIDYRLLLGTPTQTGGPSFGEMVQQAQQAQMQRAQLGQYQYEQGRQRSLNDLVSQNAGMYSDPAAKAYALGGYGEQAMQAQQMAAQRQQMAIAQQQKQMELQESAAKLDQIHRSLTASKLATVKSQDDYDKIARAVPDEYGLTPGEEYTGAVKRFRKGMITPEQEAENAQKQDALDKGRYDIKFNPVTGAAYREDKMTGQFFPVSGGGGGAGPGAPVGAPRDMPATPGSKVFTAKEAALKALGEDLDATKGKANLSTNAQKQIGQAERFEALLNAPGPFTNQRMHEATMIAATIANNGNQPTEAMVESMFPKTLKGKSADFWQSVTNLPVDADVAPFVEQLKNQSERETTTAKKQLQQYLLGRLAKHPDAFKYWPQEAGAMAEGAGLKGLYDSKSLLPVKGAHPDDAKAISWAKANSTNPLAKEILKANGVQ